MLSFGLMIRIIPENKGCSRSSEASLKCIVLAYTQSKPFETLGYYCACLVLIATKFQTYCLYYEREPVTAISCAIFSIFQTISVITLKNTINENKKKFTIIVISVLLFDYPHDQ